MSVTDDIKARLDIVQLVSSYGVTLKKAGRNYLGLCPFHNERTPSFVVFPDTQNWHCFGACGTGGDIFNFVMQRDGVDFVTALRTLAERTGVQLETRSDEQEQQDKHLDKLRSLLDECAGYFHARLMNSKDPGARLALEYARKRGLTDETLEQFKIGYAPEAWQDTLNHLKLIGYAPDDAVESGMAIRTDDGNRTYDRFRNRLVIPIHDERGRAIGFGARALNPEDNPKYLNSPQTPLFDKSATLFALHHARRAIREGETAVIVEGYMDAIQAHQSGFKNVVAQMGTALTKAQLKILGRYARRLVLALDPDAAGAKATMRGLDIVRQASESGQVFFDPGTILRQASKLDLEIQVATLPDGQDPDELIRGNPEGWKALIEGAQPVADYVITVGTANLTPKSTPAEREQVARELLPILMATENDLQRNFNIQQLAYKLRLGSGKVLVEWAQSMMQAPRVKPAEAAPAAPQAPAPAAPPEPVKKSAPPSVAMEQSVLAALLRDPDLLMAVDRKLRELAICTPRAQESLGELSTEDFTSTEHRAIFDTLTRALEQFDMDVIDFLQDRLPYELHTFLERLLEEPMDVFKKRLDRPLQAEMNAIQPGETELQLWQAALERGVLELRKMRLKRQNTELQVLQQEADTETDREYGRRVAANKAAILALDNAARRPIRA